MRAGKRRAFLASYLKASYFGELFLCKLEGQAKIVLMNFDSLQSQLSPNA